MSKQSPPSRLLESRASLTRYVRPAEDQRDLPSRPVQIKTFRRLFAYTQKYAGKRNMLFALAILRSIQLPLLVWAVGAVISGPVERRDWHGVWMGTLGFAALALFTQLIFSFRIRLALELGQQVVRDLRNDLFENLQRMTMRFYDRTKVGRVISRMTSDVDAVRTGVQDIVFVSLVQGGQMIVSALLMLWIDWALFLVLLAIAPVVWLINQHFKTRLSEAHRRMQESFSRVTATLAESVGGIRVTQGFVREEVNAGMFRELVADHSRYNMGAARMTAVFLPLLELNSQIFTAILLVLGGYRALNPDIALPPGDVVQFFFLATMFFEPIRIIGNQYTQAMTSIVGAERVFALLDTRPDWEDAPDARDIGRIEGRVEFRDLSFGYEPDRLVLTNVNFVAEPGQVVALVGHTGSGKTSVINLITKSYLPTAGELLVDGNEIRTITSRSLHHQLGMVQQHNFLFQTTVMENIRYGRPDASDEEVVEAVRTLGFLDLVENLAEGFSTRVGEGGTGLSVGQRQLVCFARALVADPRIVILDEATSSIDSMTELRIQSALETLLRGRTSFAIAHRLSTIRKADLILVMDHGRIAERGTHQSLLDLGGVYAALHAEFVRSTAG